MVVLVWWQEELAHINTEQSGGFSHVRRRLYFSFSNRQGG